MNDNNDTNKENLESVSDEASNTFVEIGQKMFKSRDYTPIPLIIILLFTAEPSIVTATLGTLLAVFGELYRIYAVAFIGSISRTRSGNTGDNLITTGPFGWSRNPLYIGNFLIVLGMAVFGGVGWVIFITIAAFAFQYYTIVKYEESVLVDKFGDEYKVYCKTVPAFLPTSIPKLAEVEWPDTFSPALKSERRTLSAIAAMLLALMLIGK